MKTLISLFAAFAIILGHRATATEAIPFYAFTPTIVGYANGGAGFAFSPLLNISVTSLGFGGTDLSTQPYSMTLWDSGGVPLASNTVSTNSPFLNQTYYEPIGAISLSAGLTYYITGKGYTNGLWVGNVILEPPDPSPNGVFVPAPDITYIGPASLTNGVSPSIIGPAYAMLVGANF